MRQLQIACDTAKFGAARLTDTEKNAPEHVDSEKTLSEIKARIEARLAELDRANDGFGFESIQQFSHGANRWPHDIASWRDAGGSHISVVTMGANLGTVDAHIDAIAQWRKVYDAVG